MLCDFVKDFTCCGGNGTDEALMSENTIEGLKY